MVLLTRKPVEGLISQKKAGFWQEMCHSKRFSKFSKFLSFQKIHFHNSFPKEVQEKHKKQHSLNLCKLYHPIIFAKNSIERLYTMSIFLMKRTPYILIHPLFVRITC